MQCPGFPRALRRTTLGPTHGVGGAPDLRLGLAAWTNVVPPRAVAEFDRLLLSHAYDGFGFSHNFDYLTNERSISFLMPAGVSDLYRSVLAISSLRVRPRTMAAPP
jgi:hypothetical protein